MIPNTLLAFEVLMQETPYSHFDSGCDDITPECRTCRFHRTYVHHHLAFQRTLFGCRYGLLGPGGSSCGCQGICFGARCVAAVADGDARFRLLDWWHRGGNQPYASALARWKCRHYRRCVVVFPNLLPFSARFPDGAPWRQHVALLGKYESAGIAQCGDVCARCGVQPIAHLRERNLHGDGL